MYTCVYSSSIHKSQKVENIQTPIKRWTDKLWYIQTLEYYSAIKRNQVLCYNSDNLKNSVLSEKVIHKRVHTVVLLYKISTIGKPPETESRLVITRRWEGRKGNDYLMGTECFSEMTREWLLHNAVNVVNATKLNIFKWLIVCCVKYTSIKKVETYK